MENEDKYQDVIVHGMQDSALLHLVLCANLDVGIDVTILSEGQLVAGNLISGKRYAEETAAKLRAANADEGVKNVLAGFFDKLSDEYKHGENNTIPLNFLHIKDPSYMNGNGSWTTIHGAIVRIAIDKVTGFSLGSPSNSK